LSRSKRRFIHLFNALKARTVDGRTVNREDTPNERPSRKWSNLHPDLGAGERATTARTARRHFALKKAAGLPTTMKMALKLGLRIVER